MNLYPHVLPDRGAGLQLPQQVWRGTFICLCSHILSWRGAHFRWLSKIDAVCLCPLEVQVSDRLSEIDAVHICVYILMSFLYEVQVSDCSVRSTRYVYVSISSWPGWSLRSLGSHCQACRSFATLMSFLSLLPFQSLMFSIQLCLCLPLFLPPCTVPCRMVFNHSSFLLFTMLSSSSCLPTFFFIAAGTY